MKKQENKPMIHKESLVIMIDPETKKETEGVFIWTPYREDLDPELVYIRDATEFIPPPDEPVSPNAKTPQKHEPDKEVLLAAAPLSRVCGYYTGGCDNEGNNDHYPNDCAHYLSNAFIRAGYSDLRTSSLITARNRKCSSGSKRAIRAYDMLKWFRSKSTRFRSGVIPRGNGIWATYQEKPGWKHVLISNTDAWEYCGTGDYPDWPVQYNYQW